MKSGVLIVLISSMALLSLSSETNFHTKAKYDTVGFAFNEQLKTDKPAISVAKASNKGLVLPNETGFTSPIIVKHLPVTSRPPRPGPLENIDEVRTEINYYNGASNLNAITVQCERFSKPACFSATSCGWCGSSNTCIPGTDLSPLAPCSDNTYLFSAPADYKALEYSEAWAKDGEHHVNIDINHNWNMVHPNHVVPGDIQKVPNPGVIPQAKSLRFKQKHIKKHRKGKKTQH